MLRHFINDMIGQGEARMAQRVLSQLQFVIRDAHLGKDTHVAHGGRIDLLAVMEAFLEDGRLDPRWRELILGRALERLREKGSRFPMQETQRAR